MSLWQWEKNSFKKFCKKGSQKYISHSFIVKEKIFPKYVKMCRIYVVYYNRKKKLCEILRQTAKLSNFLSLW